MHRITILAWRVLVVRLRCLRLLAMGTTLFILSLGLSACKKKGAEAQTTSSSAPEPYLLENSELTVITCSFSLPEDATSSNESSQSSLNTSWGHYPRLPPSFSLFNFLYQVNSGGQVIRPLYSADAADTIFPLPSSPKKYLVQRLLPNRRWDPQAGKATYTIAVWAALVPETLTTLNSGEPIQQKIAEIKNSPSLYPPLVDTEIHPDQAAWIDIPVEDLNPIAPEASRISALKVGLFLTSTTNQDLDSIKFCDNQLMQLNQLAATEDQNNADNP